MSTSLVRFPWVTFLSVRSCPVCSKQTIVEDIWTTFGGSTETDTEELHGSCGRVLGAVLWVLFVLLIIGVSIRTCRHAATGMIADDHGMVLSGSCSDCLVVGWGPRCRSVGNKSNITTLHIMNYNKLTIHTSTPWLFMCNKYTLCGHTPCFW